MPSLLYSIFNYLHFIVIAMIGEPSRIDPVLGKDPELNPDLFETNDVWQFFGAEDVIIYAYTKSK